MVLVLALVPRPRRVGIKTSPTRQPLLTLVTNLMCIHSLYSSLPSVSQLTRGLLVVLRDAHLDCVVVQYLVLLLVPRPPAPEGWDKDITTIQHSHQSTQHHNGTQCSLLALFSNTCSDHTYIRMLLPLIVLVPRSPAPEGWDRRLSDQHRHTLLPVILIRFPRCSTTLYSFPLLSSAACSTHTVGYDDCVLLCL